MTLRVRAQRPGTYTGFHADNQYDSTSGGVFHDLPTDVRRDVAMLTQGDHPVLAELVDSASITPSFLSRMALSGLTGS